MEKWKDIPGYEGIYQASDTGLIRSKPGKTTKNDLRGTVQWKSRILKFSQCGRGDFRVKLWKNKEMKTFLVARLIALTWVDGYQEGMTVNHIDGNFLNNSASNLEWITRSENIKNGFSDGLYGQSCEPVILKNGNIVREFRSMSAASRFVGRNIGYISDCIKSGRIATGSDGERYEIVKEKMT